jgi:predicted oxidoreductase
MELCINKDLPYFFKEDKESTFQPHQLHISESTNRLMVAHLDTPHLHLDIINVHAPKRIYDQDEKADKFFSHLTNTIHKQFRYQH